MGAVEVAGEGFRHSSREPGDVDGVELQHCEEGLFRERVPDEGLHQRLGHILVVEDVPHGVVVQGHVGRAFVSFQIRG